MFKENICNLTGKYENIKKLNDKVKLLIKAYCESLPHNYRQAHTKLNYFEDSSLTMKKLYLLFLDYYLAIEDEEAPITEKA